MKLAPTVEVRSAASQARSQGRKANLIVGKMGGELGKKRDKKMDKKIEGEEYKAVQKSDPRPDRLNGRLVSTKPLGERILQPSSRESALLIDVESGAGTCTHLPRSGGRYSLGVKLAY